MHCHLSFSVIMFNPIRSFWLSSFIDIMVFMEINLLTPFSLRFSNDIVILHVILTCS